MTLAINVENISKEFLVGKAHQNENFREAFQRFLLAPLYRYKTLSGQVDEALRFQALEDVSFKVKQGEILGLIGANGAGKSTLLKILSRITPPSKGRATIEGTVGSLLEVGIGFNRELTGRENIYLNGAILGMRRAEIKRELDAIVDFAGVEKFLDTPVKRYSSGMYVRLAFAVAAHLKTDILLVDEVLAVGDKAFQEKCLGKMDDLSQDGRTIIFVSHNLAVIENLCERVLVLNEGRLAFDGPTDDAIAHYASEVAQNTNPVHVGDLKRAPHYRSVLKSVAIQDEHGQMNTNIPAFEGMQLVFDYDFGETVQDPYVGFSIETPTGLKLLTCSTRQNGCEGALPAKGKVLCNIPSLSLAPGNYFISMGCGERRRPIDGLERCAQIEIRDGDVFGTGFVYDRRHGHLISKGEFKVMSD
ncbi:MAG: hypothetical protein CMH56_02265 [Myxococcales bacterium]|nr:hypothetical protein [Myxococcales bacterium]|tara:strand:- start:7286 stop:8536 length:1251 start_codon:yes stop_codon:yes gene_type:complete